MRKKVTAREIPRDFARPKKKRRNALKVTLPDFEQDASRAGFDAKVGDRLLVRLLNDEARSD
jgi:hypothetical protein